MAKVLEVGPDAETTVKVGDIVYHGPAVRIARPDGRDYQILHPAAIQASLERDFFSREADMIAADTTQAVSALVFEYIYFWRVRGQNAGGFGPWSPTWFIEIVADGQIRH